MYKYDFKNYRGVNKGNYRELSDVFQKEMEQIAKFDAGYNDGTIESFMLACETEFPNEPGWDLYDVTLRDHPEKVIYHFWKYFDEYGSLFCADSGEDAGIGMMNFDFMLHDGSIEQLKLCKELQESFYEKK